MDSSDIRLANETWEALFRAQRTIGRELKDSDIWDGLLENEYDVLYALSAVPDGVPVGRLTTDALITRAGLSRLIARMEDIGLVERSGDPSDGRVCWVRLTPDGVAKQRRIGRAHAREVSRAMGSRLDRAQLIALRDASRALLDAMPVPHVDQGAAQ